MWPVPHHSLKTYAPSHVILKGMKALRTLMCLPVPAHLLRFLCKMKGFSLGYVYLLWQDHRSARGKAGEDLINMSTQAWVALTFQVKSQYSQKIFCHWFWRVFMQSDICGRQRHICTNWWKLHTVHIFVFHITVFVNQRIKNIFQFPSIWHPKNVAEDKIYLSLGILIY